MSTFDSTTEKRSGNSVFIILLLGCSALLVLSLWFGQQILQQPDDNLFAPDPDCRLPQNSCTASHDQHHIRFTINTDQLNADQPFPVRVELSGYNNPQVTVKLQSISMFMGETLTTLKQQPDGSYQANIQLPICSFDTRQWRANILINDQTGSSGSWFDFEAG